MAGSKSHPPKDELVPPLKLASIIGWLCHDLRLAYNPALAMLCGVAKETNANRVFWNRRHEPVVIVRDRHEGDAFGERWFWNTLVDADLAQNTLGWQWIAGCGADAAPCFRVFNPTTQGEKFYPHAHYVWKGFPELAHLSAKWGHQPHTTPAEILLKHCVPAKSNSGMATRSPSSVTRLRMFDW